MVVYYVLTYTLLGHQTDQFFLSTVFPCFPLSAPSSPTGQENNPHTRSKHIKIQIAILTKKWSVSTGETHTNNVYLGAKKR